MGFDSHGDSRGHAVFFFHGVPGSRLYWNLARPENAASKSRVRLIAADRPGLGLSDPLDGRTVSSVSRDVTELADLLGIQSFSVLGYSGGAVYALAAAAALPDRVDSVALLSPVADLSVPRLASSLDPAARRALGLISRSRRTALRALMAHLDAGQLVTHAAEQAWSHLPAADRRVLASPSLRTAAAATMRESARQGISGPLRDLELLSSPWEMELDDVRAPVDVFAGGVDPWSTEEMVHWLARSLPDCRVHRFAREGHFTLLSGQMDEVLGSLVAAAHPAVSAESTAAAKSDARVLEAPIRSSG